VSETLAYRRKSIQLDFASFLHLHSASFCRQPLIGSLREVHHRFCRSLATPYTSAPLPRGLIPSVPFTLQEAKSEDGETPPPRDQTMLSPHECLAPLSSDHYKAQMGEFEKSDTASCVQDYAELKIAPCSVLRVGQNTRCSHQCIATSREERPLLRTCHIRAVRAANAIFSFTDVGGAPAPFSKYCASDVP
jgi:hypothetical protein